jgi:hypothetical protein
MQWSNENAYKYLVKTIKGIKHLVHPGINGQIIMKYIIRDTRYLEIRTGFSGYLVVLGIRIIKCNICI